MKKTKITCLTLATVMMASSCTSSYQAAGGMTGAMIGSSVGEAVGFLSGHGPFRGENAALGSLIGMGIGAVLGVGIASQIEENEKVEARRYEERNNDSYGYQNRANATDGYYGDQDYQIGGGAYNGASTSAYVSISDLSYMDSDGDGYFSKDETVEVEGYITNTATTPLRDIVIYLNVNEQKNIAVSPSLTTTLQPGQKIRYTGRLHCRKIRAGQSVAINLNTTYAGKTTTSNTLFVRMR
ncbi:MAG: hypothetical protein IJ635_11085 [Bacteroidaceae bacterium]|nr:hypothetical protein [Bacteroidaceae bacterium]